jgi:hypothetical protein
MDTALTIEEFSSFLNTKAEDNSLLEALRKLMSLREPEDITIAFIGPLFCWQWRG